MSDKYVILKQKKYYMLVLKKFSQNRKQLRKYRLFAYKVTQLKSITFHRRGKRKFDFFFTIT